MLTKPDTLLPGASGARKRWQDVIQGREHKLRHGYYCVRLPDDEERMRKVTRADALKIANEFFENNLPWNTIPDRNRFGIPNLVMDISRLLVSLIENM